MIWTDNFIDIKIELLLIYLNKITYKRFNNNDVFKMY